MARTILEIAQEAAARDNTAPPPSSLFGNANRIARILRVALGDTMREILRTSAWQGLSEAHSTWVMVLKPGRYAYPLPPDFLRMIPDTENRGGWPMGLIGPATPQAWSAWVNGGAAVAAPMGWRIRNNAIFFDPTPTTEEVVTIEYVSKYPVVSPVLAGDYNAETPPDAVPPAVPRDGYMDGTASEAVYAGTATGAEFAYGTAPGWDAAVWAAEFAEILRRINPLSLAQPAPQVRRPEFTADTDMPAFEDDHILSMGLTYRLRRALGLPYAEHAAEFEADLEMMIAADAGGARAFAIGRERGCDDVIPLGGGLWSVG